MSGVLSTLMLASISVITLLIQLVFIHSLIGLLVFIEQP